jgi:lipopolysaccharide/colanic/teichoic acid biosynthesis glycosyltransferase
MTWNLCSALRRVSEVIICAAALVFLAPLLVSIALAVKLDSRGPIFFRQDRLGKDGSTFRIWKFRSMVVGAEEMGAGMIVTADDPRITRVGRILRRFSLDELPQLINVLKGDMGIVGPRPGLPSHLQIYNEFQVRRLEVKPGLTGLAQVNGRAALGWSERIELDIEYVDNRSFLLDVSIAMRTFRVLLRSDLVYNPEGGAWKPEDIPDFLKGDTERDCASPSSPNLERAEPRKLDR